MTAVTVTLNAAVDKTYIVPGFALGRIHRPAEAGTTAGGKGINVARVYRALEGIAVATGFLGGMNGELIAKKLAEESIPADFIQIADESRLAIAVLDPEAHTQTEINEIGPNISQTELAALVDKVANLIGQAKWLFLCGSTPPGVPKDTYARLIQMAHNAGARAVLDTSGAPLEAAIQERPYLVKPNRHELAALGIALNGWADAPAAAMQLRARYGVKLALVTGGQDGAVLATDAGVWRAKPPLMDIVSAVGSGDSLAAAFIWALDKDPNDYAGALAWGVAAGAANTQTSGAGFCTRDQIESVLGKIVLESVDSL